MAKRRPSKTVSRFKEDGVSVTVKVSSGQWTRAVEASLAAVLPIYPYLSMKDILEHLNEQWDFLLKEENTDENEYAEIHWDSLRLDVDAALGDSVRADSAGEGEADDSAG